ncbi:unnamed protein product [Clonostachys rosea]|uniref:HNH nuclease domain-containing protein n=1 Tax=Bionectria ochroleuca TaxID=29856 RepID=A0ABY6TYR7_BIOOC|nr:unnamed protein product [Clonostachys rosea]
MARAPTNDVEIGHIYARDNRKDSNGLASYDDLEVNSIPRKVEVDLYPMPVVPFLVSYLDRGNISNAKVAGINESPALTDGDYRITPPVARHV